MSDQERRFANRIPFPEQCSLSYSGESSPQLVRVHDLSAGGVALICDVSLAVDEQVEISFGSDSKVQIKGVVQHSLQNDAGKFQLGIRFLVEME